MADVGDYERATGVEEHLRQCMAKGCNHFFRAPSADTLCPVCGNDRTRDTRNSAGLATGTAGSGNLVTK